ncbi:MAG: hypothetical protein JWN56_1282 [Sphingobacteriales bacterium]|nr:hypothetical protein [Sphingobacteriales bacterium]
MRRKKIYVLVVLFFLFFQNTKAQDTRADFIYLEKTDSTYVLSENSGDYGDINSLFIWRKDRVLRIIFKYDTITPAPDQIDIKSFTSINTIIPPFQYYNLYNKSKWVGESFLLELGIDKKNKLKYLFDPINYIMTVGIIINDWNKKHNKSADMLKGYDISEGGYQQTLLLKRRGNKQFANNLPIIFRLPGEKSFSIIKPYSIDIYKADHFRDVSFNNNSNQLKCFTHTGNINLMDESVYTKSYTANFEGRHMEEIAPFPSLAHIYKGNFPQAENAILNSLTAFEFSDRKYYNYTGDIAPPSVLIIPDNHSGTLSSDSISSKVIAKDNKEVNSSVYECFAELQYCAECYNPKISKVERFKRHCPLSLRNHQNWSYAFYQSGKPYFKVERYHDYDTISANPGIPNIWQLMTPGVGFWISDVANKRPAKYFIPQIKNENTCPNKFILIN